jgi:TRAP-type C4-dicarboxylate transport system permease small subunit
VTIERVERAALATGDAILGIVVAVIVVLTAVQVGGRYLFDASLPWVQELVRILFVWAVMIGTAVACGRSSHIAFDGFVERAGPVWTPRIRLAMTVGVVGFLVLIAVTGTELVFRNIGQRTSVMGLPMSLAYAAIPVGAALGAVATVVAARRAMRR